MEEIVRVYLGDLVIVVPCSKDVKTAKFQENVLQAISKRNPKLPTDPASYKFIQTSNGRFLHYDLILEHKNPDGKLDISLICMSDIPKEFVWQKQQSAKYFVDGLDLSPTESTRILDSFKEDLIKTVGDICYLQKDDLKRLHLGDVREKIKSRIAEINRQYCIHINCLTCEKDLDTENEDEEEKLPTEGSKEKIDTEEKQADGEEKAPQKIKVTRDLSEFTERNYDVVKINLVGRRQNRVLRLTSTEISNVRNGKITANHGYNDVFCVTMKESQTFVVSFVNDHNFTYRAPNAMDIVYEINERLAARRNREKSLFTYNLVKIPMKYQAKIFKEKGGMKEKGSAKVSAEQSQQLLDVLRGGTSMKRKTSAPDLAVQKSASKIEAILGSSQKQRIQHYVENLLLDPTTEEGKARARFLKNFSVIEKEPHTLLGVIRQFMDSLRVHIENKHSKYLKGTAGATTLDDEGISNLIEESIQKAVVMPKYQKIKNALQGINRQKHSKIMNKKRILRSKQQAFYGIKSDEISSSNWSAATYELDFMDKKLLPVEKLAVLLKTARAIYNTHNYERNRKEAESRSKDENGLIEPQNFFLAADEFFPIFLFVVVNSNIAFLEVTKQFLWGLCERGSLTGEGGYYLTVFEATVEYIHSFDVTATSPNDSKKSSDTRFSACE